MSTIGLSDHELRSIRRFLHEVSSLASLPIYIQRARLLERPSLGLKEVGRTEPDHGRVLVESRATWQIDIMGTDIWTTKALRNTVVELLRSADLIPLRLFDWAYPQVRVRGLSEVGSADPTQTMWAGVTALDADGAESLPAMASAEVLRGDDIEVLWPDWPGTPIATGGYRVYAGPSPDALALYASPSSGQYPTEHWNDIEVGVSSGSPTGGGPPDRSEIFANRFINVESVGSRDVEHPDRDGIWNSFVTLVTCLYGSRLQTPGVRTQDVPRPFRTIEVSISP